MRDTDEPWIVGFLRRLTAVGTVFLFIAGALGLVVAAIVATGLAVTAEEWSVPARVLLGLGVFAALDLAGGIAVWAIAAAWRGLFWVLTGKPLAAR